MFQLRASLKPRALRAISSTATRVWKWLSPGSVVILMYHRVLPRESAIRKTEQPSMYVSPEVLDMHLSHLGQHFQFVCLEDWLRRAAQRAPLPRLSCAITFDDGWRDNLEFGLPVLRKHSAPATVFLVSDYIGSSRRFWPNRLMSLIHHSYAKPDSVVFPPRLESIVHPVLAEARQRGQLGVADTRHIIACAKMLSETEILELVDGAELSTGNRASEREVLSSAEIEHMAASGLIHFGCHTATHYRLGGPVSAEDLQREVVLSKRTLQDICGQPIDVFCYPNGDLSPQAVDVVRRHYLAAVTTRKGWHSVSRDPHLIRRIGLHEAISSSPESLLSRVSGLL